MKNFLMSFIAITIFQFVSFNTYGQDIVTVESPTGKSKATLELSEGSLYWTVSYQGKQVLKKSKLGVALKQHKYKKPFHVVGLTNSSKDTIWKPVWGKVSKIRDNYNEIVWTVQSNGGSRGKLDIIVRAYDDGIALRYRINGKGKVTIKDDQTQFSFAENFTCWSANEYRPNLKEINLQDFIGPVKLSQFKGSIFPITVKVADDCYAAILEAGIYDIAKISPLLVDSTTIRATHKPSSVTLPFETSWRVVQLGEISWRPYNIKYFGKLKSR